MTAEELAQALSLDEPSVRQKAALIAGSSPQPDFVPLLVERCAIEPDFFVRDMLTWALIHHNHADVVQALLPELASVFPQARAQAMHTISKLNDSSLYPTVTPELLFDVEDEVACTAWRAATRMVPEGQEPALVDLLETQFGRGDRSVQMSLSKALVQLAPSSVPAIERAIGSDDPIIKTHGLATQRLLEKPEAGYDLALEYAQRVLAQLGAPTPPDDTDTTTEVI